MLRKAAEQARKLAGGDSERVQPKRQERYDPAALEADAKMSRLKAWNLNKQMHPRKSTLFEEMDTFWRGGSAAPAMDGGKRTVIVDSGATFHLIIRNHLSEAEQKTIRRTKKPISLSTANGPVTAEFTVKVHIVEL